MKFLSIYLILKIQLSGIVLIKRKQSFRSFSRNANVATASHKLCRAGDMTQAPRSQIISQMSGHTDAGGADCARCYEVHQIAANSARADASFSQIIARSLHFSFKNFLSESTYDEYRNNKIKCSSSGFICKCFFFFYLQQCMAWF